MQASVTSRDATFIDAVNCYPKLEIAPLLSSAALDRAQDCLHGKHKVAHLCKPAPQQRSVNDNMQNTVRSASRKRSIDTCLEPLLQQWADDEGSPKHKRQVQTCCVVSEGSEECSPETSVKSEIPSECRSSPGFKECAPPFLPDTIPRFFKDWVIEKFRTEGVRANKVLVSDCKYEQLLSIAALDGPAGSKSLLPGGPKSGNNCNTAAPRMGKQASLITDESKKNGKRAQQYFSQSQKDHEALLPSVIGVLREWASKGLRVSKEWRPENSAAAEQALPTGDASRIRGQWVLLVDNQRQSRQKKLPMNQQIQRVMHRQGRLEVVPISQIVGLVERVHASSGHSGVNRTHNMLAKQYYGVSRRMVEVIISHCSHKKCASRVKKGMLRRS